MKNLLIVGLFLIPTLGFAQMVPADVVLTPTVTPTIVAVPQENDGGTPVVTEPVVAQLSFTGHGRGFENLTPEGAMYRQWEAILNQCRSIVVQLTAMIEAQANQ